MTKTKKRQNVPISTKLELAFKENSRYEGAQEKNAQAIWEGIFIGVLVTHQCS